jgi:AraC-like DNA-binding protein
MSKEIKTFSINDIVGQLSENDKNVLSPDIVLMMDSEAMRPIISIGQPYQLTDGRLVRVTGGTASGTANLLPFSLTAQSVCILPPASILQYESASDDFRVQAFSYSTMPAALAFDRVTLLHLDDVDFRRTGDYLQLIQQVLHKERYSMRTIQLLQMALFNDLHHIQTIEAERQPEVKPSRQEHVFNQFIDLVNKHGSRERRIQFYAERLLLSPNRLSTIIKDYSGHTIMEWLNEKTLLQAKVLLRHSDLMIYEIADRLGFPEPTAFNRYFKREVGVTPSEYRN